MPFWNELVIYQMHPGTFPDQRVDPQEQYDREFGNFFSYDTMSGPGGMNGLPYHATVGIGPYTAIILSQ